MPGILDAISAFSFLGVSVGLTPKIQRRSLLRGTQQRHSASALRKFRVPKARIEIATQWDRLHVIIETAAASTIRARECHVEARAHLEAAEVSLDRILDEIGTVMPLNEPMTATYRAASSEPILLAA